MAFKLVIIGNSCTGKTSLLNRYAYQTFDDRVPTTIGVEFTHKDLEGDTHLVLWDTAGQERYQSITSSLYNRAHALMFVYDVSNIESFEGLHRWWREYISFGDVNTSVAILVGNKTDLERKVPIEMARQWAAQRSLSYVEVSAYSNEGVDTAFATLVHRMRELPQVKKAQELKSQAPKSDRCCY